MSEEFKNFDELFRVDSKENETERNARVRREAHAKESAKTVSKLKGDLSGSKKSGDVTIKPKKSGKSGKIKSTMGGSGAKHADAGRRKRLRRLAALRPRRSLFRRQSQKPRRKRARRSNPQRISSRSGTLPRLPPRPSAQPGPKRRKSAKRRLSSPKTGRPPSRRSASAETAGAAVSAASCSLRSC